MSAALETLSPSKSTISTGPLMEKDEQNEKKTTNNGGQHGAEESNSKRTNDNADGRDEKGAILKIEIPLGQLQMNKGDESLSKLKENSAGNEVVSNTGDSSKETEVQMLSLSIISPGRSDIVLSDPFASSPKACLFTLKEGSKYRIKFYFTVSNNTVSGLKYISSVYKAGVRVDKSTVLLGTFGPRQEPYEYELEEDTTPSGVFVRGLYSARVKVVDEKGTCHFDINYYFDIQKNWSSST